MRGFHSFVVVVIVALACPALGAPMYSFVDLHQPGVDYYNGRFFHAGGGKVFGEADAVSGDGRTHALLWDIAGGRTDLHPAGATGSHGGGTTGSQHAGTVEVTNGEAAPQHAMLWIDGIAEPIDLHPSGYLQSGAFDAVEGQQAGAAYTETSEHAMLWRGTAASAVDLHPAAGPARSVAFTLAQNAQGGYITFGGIGGVSHAALWHGTAQSMVDLNPAGFTYSQLYDITDEIQVGWASTGARGEAMLWRGSAASAVSLHPTGALNSIAFGTNGHQHVGMVDFDPVLSDEPVVWDGDSPDDFVRLRDYMPEEWNVHEVYVRAMDEQGNIFGEANGHVIAWVVPEPSAGVVILGCGAIRLLAFRRRRR